MATDWNTILKDGWWTPRTLTDEGFLKLNDYNLIVKRAEKIIGIDNKTYYFVETTQPKDWSERFIYLYSVGHYSENYSYFPDKLPVWTNNIMIVGYGTTVLLYMC